MLDRILEEELVLLNRSFDYVPRSGGKKIHPSTAYRWAMRGVMAGGRRIRLETVVIGGIRYTSRQAEHRFTAQLTAARAGHPQPTFDKKPSKRLLQAEAELKRMGF